MMFACWDPIEPITYGVYNVYAGWWGVGFLLVVPSFASWYAISLHGVYSNFLYYYVVFSP